MAAEGSGKLTNLQITTVRVSPMRSGDNIEDDERTIHRSLSPRLRFLLGRACTTGPQSVWAF